MRRIFFAAVVMLGFPQYSFSQKTSVSIIKVRYIEWNTTTITSISCDMFDLIRDVPTKYFIDPKAISGIDKEIRSFQRRAVPSSNSPDTRVKMYLYKPLGIISEVCISRGIARIEDKNYELDDAFRNFILDLTGQPAMEELIKRHEKH